MVNLVNLENVTKSYGLKTLLDGVSLGVDSTDRIGVVGLNGGGKSTLIKVLSGLEEPDSGRVSHAGGLRLAVVTQHVDLDPEATIADVVVAPLGLKTFEWASNAKVREVLGGLGIAELGLETCVSNLSGGEKRRVNLAAALVKDLDLVVLDEPTNHLDIEGVAWLAHYLLSRKIAIVVVTHDRWFLDTVATRTWEVHDGRVDAYDGGYNDWTFARVERTRQADATEQRRRNMARKELAWLLRGAPARTSKPRYRIDAAKALIADVPELRNRVELMAFSRKRQGKVVIDLEDASFSTPDGKTLVDDLTWRIAPGERIGLVGVNGSGKTTLLKALAGEIPLDHGRRIAGRTLRLGYLRQELDDLDPSLTVIEAVEEQASYIDLGDGREISASQLAERLGFSPKRQRTPVKDLSGGERRRLQLTRVLMTEPNMLLLDEPTNDLDIDTLQELESLLDGWAGSLVVISHDRYLIERVCDSTWALFGDGKLTNLPGGIEQYLSRRAELLASKQANSSSENAKASVSDAMSGSKRHQLGKDMSRIERKLAKIDSSTHDLNTKMVKASEAMDAAEIARLSARLDELAADRDELEAEWMSIGELLEDS